MCRSLALGIGAFAVFSPAYGVTLASMARQRVYANCISLFEMIWRMAAGIKVPIPHELLN